MKRALSAPGQRDVNRASTAVVLIDDDKDLLDLLARNLRTVVPDDISYELALAETPETGLEKIQNIRADRPLIVFCDFNLRAGTTGADLLVEIARLRPRALRVLISGHSQSYLQPALDACRPDAFLEKPLEMNQLVAEMARLVVQAATLMDRPSMRVSDGRVVLEPTGATAPPKHATAKPPERKARPAASAAVAANATLPLEPLDAERAIHQAVDDRYFRLMAESLSDYAAFLLDVDGRVVTWNRGAQRIKGYTAEEIIGEHFSRFYPQPDIDARKTTYELRRAAEDGRFENTGWRLRKDGTRFWANVVITALRDESGRLLGFAKITRDLTEQRNMEEMLRESEARYRLLIENVKDYAIVMLDTEGHVLSWSEGAFQSTGYNAEEALGQHLSILYPEAARAKNEPDADLRQALAEGRHEEEGWRLRRDGSRFWANVVITPLHDHLGQHRGFAQVLRDLTLRREAEEAARQQTEELKAVMRELDAFNDAVAHDLRGPVRALLGYATLLAENDRDAEEQALFAARIKSVTERMAEIIEDLLNLSRSTKSDLRRTMVDLSSLAQEIIGRYVAEGRAEATAFTVQPGMNAPGDPQLLRLVMENIINNAIKFSAKAGPMKIEVGSLDQDGTIVYFVRDQGVGFDESQAGELFRPFVRLHARGEYEGTGIGLATVHRVIARHGGRVWAKSRPNKGATFYFTLGS